MKTLFWNGIPPPPPGWWAHASRLYKANVYLMDVWIGVGTRKWKRFCCWSSIPVCVYKECVVCPESRVWWFFFHCWIALSWFESCSWTVWSDSAEQSRVWFWAAGRVERRSFFDGEGGRCSPAQAKARQHVAHDEEAEAPERQEAKAEGAGWRVSAFFN